VVNDKSPYRSLADVVAGAKARPGRISLASPGNGTVAHLSAELLQRAAGIELIHIPYKGAAPALTDLMGGQVDLYASSVSSAIGQLKGGKVRALAVTSAKRSPALPEVPTVAESGYPGYNAVGWGGIFVPNGTPQPIIDKLNATIAKVVTLPEVKKQFEEQGTEGAGSTQAEMAKLLREEYARLGQTAKSIGVSVN